MLVMCGCDDTPRTNYDGLGLVPVTGTITLDGKPLPDAVVSFEAADGQTCYGVTNSGGRYELQVDSAMKGCTRGPRTVRVSTARRVEGLNTSEDEKNTGEAPAKPKPAEVVPAQFNKDSKLSVEVTPDKTRYDFDLKS